MRFRVQGRARGVWTRDSWVIDAPSPEAARRRAEGLGILVEMVLPEVESQTPPAPARAPVSSASSSLPAAEVATITDPCLGGWCRPFEEAARPRYFRLPVTLPAASFAKADVNCPHCGWPLEVTVYSAEWNTASARGDGADAAWGSAKTLGWALPATLVALAALLPAFEPADKGTWAVLAIPAILALVSAYQLVRLAWGLGRHLGARRQASAVVRNGRGHGARPAGHTGGLVRAGSADPTQRSEQEEFDVFLRWVWVLGVALGCLLGFFASLPQGSLADPVPKRVTANGAQVLRDSAWLFAMILLFWLVSLVYAFHRLVTQGAARRNLKRELLWWLLVPVLLWLEFAILALLTCLQWLAWLAGVDDVTRWPWSVPLGGVAGGVIFLALGYFCHSTSPRRVRVVCGLIFGALPPCVAVIAYLLFWRT